MKTFGKLITMNNKIFIHIITKNKNGEIYDIYLNQENITNLFNNKNISITLKKAIPENNEKNFKPRPETIGKLDTKNNILKIAIGKGFKPIEKSEDIDKTLIFEYTNELNNIFKTLTEDFLKYEEYKNLKSELAKFYKSKNIKKEIDF